MQYTLHPSVYKASDGSLHLKVMKHLVEDPTLPKYLVDGKVMNKYSNISMSIQEYINSPDGMSSYRNAETTENAEKSIFSRFINFIMSFKKLSIPPKTFKDVKELLDKNIITDDIERAAENLKEIIKKTSENGQVALANRLKNECSTAVLEAVLVKHKLNHYLTEKDIVNVLKKANKGIRIDFWNDYPEFIPDEVLDIKRHADSLRVFDNWCIMHYDPSGSALKQIKTEEWRRDPILFGLILGSDRLYYVKDWVTKDDDLTIDKVCKTLSITGLREAKEYGVVSAYSDQAHNIVYNVGQNVRQ